MGFLRDQHPPGQRFFAVVRWREICPEGPGRNPVAGSNMLTSNSQIAAFGRAWLVLCTVTALHLLEESTTGFLEDFAPLVHTVGLAIGIPAEMPSYSIWLAAIASLIAFVFVLTPLAFRGRHWVVLGSYVFAALMVGNGVNHLLSPLYLGHFLPGQWTSPFLILASIQLVAKANTCRLAARQANTPLNPTN